MLRASGTAALVRASSERAPFESMLGGGDESLSVPREAEGAIAASSVAPSTSSPCLTMARPSAAASSFPVG